MRDFLFGQPQPVFKDCTVVNDLDCAFQFTSDEREMKIADCTVTNLRGLGFHIREDRHMNLLQRLWRKLTRPTPDQVQIGESGGISIQARGDVHINGALIRSGEKATFTNDGEQSS